jgi:hypothetical protein
MSLLQIAEHVWCAFSAVGAILFLLAAFDAPTIDEDDES